MRCHYEIRDLASLPRVRGIEHPPCMAGPAMPKHSGMDFRFRCLLDLSSFFVLIVQDQCRERRMDI